MQVMARWKRAVGWLVAGLIWLGAGLAVAGEEPRETVEAVLQADRVLPEKAGTASESEADRKEDQTAVFDGKGEEDYRKGLVACDRKYASHAIKLLTKAAGYGYVDAMLKLGQMYADGELVVANEETAFRWYKQAADQGSPIGEYKVGMMYLRGQGVARDKAQAAAWLGKSARQGYARAQTNYGSLHVAGMGVPQDFVEAVNWFRKAAKQEYGDAQYLMGVAYEYGEGVPQDVETARAWYRRAVANGNGNAAGPLYRLEGYQREER